MNDPIVDEVRRFREAHSARFNFDLDAIFRDIKEQEKNTGLKFVNGEARQVQPKQPPQLPCGSALPVSEHSQLNGEPTD